MSGTENPYAKLTPDVLRVAIEKALEFIIEDQEAAQNSAAQARAQMDELAKLQAALKMSASQQ